jgi:hypothetical protein
MDKVDLNFFFAFLHFFCIFLKSPHQVDMKNLVECKKYFFAYFNALETRSDLIHENKENGIPFCKCFHTTAEAHTIEVFKVWVF